MITVDMTGVEEGKALGLLPEGEYQVQITEAEEGE